MLPRPKGTLSEIALEVAPCVLAPRNATYFEALGIFEALCRAHVIGLAASHARAKRVRIENPLVSLKSARIFQKRSKFGIK